MENWFKDTFDGVDFENDEELDDIEAAEEEAALYSVVHHSEESFETPANSAGINSDDYPHSARSKASRWHKISKTVPVEHCSPYENGKRPKTCADYISLETPNLQCPPIRRGVERNRNGNYMRFNGGRRKYSHDIAKHSRSRTSYFQSQPVPSNERQETHEPNVPLNISSETIQFSFLEELRKLNTARSLEVMQTVDNSANIPRFFENPLPWPMISSVQNTNVHLPVQIENSIVNSAANNNILLNRQNKEVENCAKAPNHESLSTKVSDLLEKVPSTNQKFVSEACDSVQREHSDTDSDIVEIKVPPKPPPPVIALDSGDEVDKMNASNEDPDVIVLESDIEDLKEVESAQPTLINVTSAEPPRNIPTGRVALPQATTLIEAWPKISPKKSTGKELKKKQKKKNRSCDAVQCNDPKTQMEKFYSESWGGETFDHMAMLRKMSNNPQHWKIVEADRYGFIDLDPLAQVRCRYCNERGHLMKNCPRQKLCCFMCGQMGHKDFHCPAKRCLRCGQPSVMFNDGCASCMKIPLRCDRCGQKDHFSVLCPNIWRHFHSVTTVEGAKNNVLPAAVYKDPNELACCTCAQRGHTTSRCPRKGSLGRLDGFSNIYYHNRMTGIPFANRGPMKRKPRDWHGETSRHNWNDHHYKKRRTF